MAQYKAIYHRYDGSAWHKYYFATTADMVAETTGLKVLTAAERTAISTYLTTFQTAAVNDNTVANKLVQANAQGKIDPAQIAGGLPYLNVANPTFTGTLTGSASGIAVLPGGIRAAVGGNERIVFISAGMEVYADNIKIATFSDALGGLVMNNALVRGLASPSIASDAATKGYVDGLIGEGAKPVESVKAATTANITLSAPQTIDGISVVAGNRVLVKAQTTATDNGIYTVNAGAWTKVANDSVIATLVFVEAGTVNNDRKYYNKTGTSWILFSNPDVMTAGAGLSRTGNEMKIADLGIVNGMISASAAIVTSKLADTTPVQTEGLGTAGVPVIGALLAHLSKLYTSIKSIKGTTHWNTTGTDLNTLLTTKNRTYLDAVAPVAGAPYINGDVFVEVVGEVT